MTGVALRGVRASGAVQIATTVLKIIPLLAVILVAAFVLGSGDSSIATTANVASMPVGPAAIAGAAESHSSRPVMTRPPVGNREDYQSLEGLAAAREGSGGAGSTAGGMGNRPGSRRVLVHASGFRQSPYADIKPPGDDAAAAARKAAREPKAPRKLWHTSPGSPG